MVKESGKRILCCAVDGGAYGALAPVATELQTDGHSVSWVTHQDGVASKKLDESAYRIEDTDASISAILGMLKPDVVVAGVSGNDSDLVHHLPAMAMEMGIKVVKVLDFWGTGMPYEKGFAPDRLCVLDDASIDYEVTMRKMLRSHIVATGAPQFDALMDVKPLPVDTFFGNHRKDGPLILFIGSSTTERIHEILEPLLVCFSDFHRPATFGTLWHPKWRKQEPDSDAFIARTISEFSPFAHMQYISDETLRGLGSNDELIASADLLVGSTSSELVKACYLRRPTLSILPQGGKNHEVLTSREMTELPTSVCGASIHIGQNGLWNFYEQFSEQGDAWARTRQAMLHAQEQNYHLDGQNTARVVAVIESLF